MGILGSDGVLVVVTFKLESPHAILSWATRSGGFLKALSAAPGLLRLHHAIEAPTKVVMVSYWQDMKALMNWYASEDHQKMVAWASTHSGFKLSVELYKEEKGGTARGGDDQKPPPRALPSPS